MSVSLDRIGVPAPLVLKTPALPSSAPSGLAPTEPARRDQSRRFGDDPDAIACTCNADPWEASTASAEDLLERAKPVFSHLVERTAANGLRGFSTALHVLAQYPGDTWQERWNASPAGREPEWLIEAILATGRQRTAALQGQLALLVLGPVRPSYWWLGQQDFQGTYAQAREIRDAAGCERVQQAAVEHGIAAQGQAQIARVLSRLLIHTGKTVADITADDLLEMDAYVQATNDRKNQVNRLWEVLHRLGQVEGPTSLRHARHNGQRTAEELVASYNVQSDGVRDVLIRYLKRRQPTLDYPSFTGLVSDLVQLFWRQVEELNPGIDSLRLTEEQAEAWRERATYKLDPTKGKRRDSISVYMTVRAFYLDIAEWALTEPELWAQWAAPSPVRQEHVRKYADNRRERTARMNQRTRVQAEALPQLVSAAARRLKAAAELLEVATAACEDGQRFDFGGQQYARHISGQEKRFGVRGTRVVTVRDSLGNLRNLTKEEDNAFWSWAVVEVLRETGIRVEELQELTHTAITPYTDPKSRETLVLLTIAPSKVNAERVLLVSPELMNVFASILKRIRRPDGTVPLLSRWDEHELESIGPLPFLFARPTPGGNRACMSSRAVQNLLNGLVAEADIRNPDGSPAHFTPHDFRRIFSTDVVAEGLPIHIAAAILGHRSLTTTQGYVAVYPEHIMRDYRQFISARRALRPQSEYRAPTAEEWSDFENHFTLRKLELGDCSRPYGTPCKHEHACVRCPMLRPDPEQRERLQAIQSNLQERLEEAERNGWGGEAAGLRETLRAAEDKLAQMSRSAGPVALGMPRLGVGPPEQ